MIGLERLPYLGSTVLLLIGLWGLFTRSNLLKKVVALGVAQASVILFFVASGWRPEGVIPVVDKAGADPATVAPLPHVLMLTAIVVGVATVGVALALLARINEDWGTIEEDSLLERLK